MHHDYPDLRILARGAPPVWYDENGTPRWAPFNRFLCPNIYASWVVLLMIRCQHCDQLFFVQMSGHWLTPLSENGARNLHYGDPPAHYCTGDSMNCDDMMVVEVWRKDADLNWFRSKEEEGPVDREETRGQG